MVIGSLAAARAFFTDDDAMLVQTKDIDCMLRPFQPVTRIDELKEAGERILGDVIEPLLERIEEDPWNP